MNNDEQTLGEGNCPYSWLNEWLCEYVDGTMDPSLRRVFEKYVEANPELKAHIEQLRRTRQLLCQCSRTSQQKTPDPVRARVQEKVEGDLLRTPCSIREAVQERPVAAVTSSLVVALVIGMFAGATLFAPEAVPTRTAQTPDTPPPLYEHAFQQTYHATTTSRQATPAMPNAASSAAFHALVEHNMGMPYTVDTTADADPWQAAIRQP